MTAPPWLPTLPSGHTGLRRAVGQLAALDMPPYTASRRRRRPPAPVGGRPTLLRPPGSSPPSHPTRAGPDNSAFAWALRLQKGAALSPADALELADFAQPPTASNQRRHRQSLHPGRLPTSTPDPADNGHGSPARWRLENPEGCPPAPPGLECRDHWSARREAGRPPWLASGARS